MNRIVLFFILSASLLTAQVRRETERELYRAHIAAAAALLELRETGEVKRHLAAAPAKHRGWEWQYLTAASDASVRTFTGHTAAVTAVTVAPDGRIVTGSADSTIRLWSAEGTQTAVLRGHGGQVSTLDCSADGRLLSGSTDKSVKLWDLGTSSLLRTVTDGLSQGVYAVRFHPDGERFGAASWDFTRTPFAVHGFAAMYDLASGNRLARFEGTGHPMSSIAFTADGTRMLTGDWGMLLQVIGLDSGRVLQRIDIDDRDDYRAIQSVALRPGDGEFAAAGKDNRIRIFDTGNGTLRRVIEAWEGHFKDVNAVVYAPDGRRFATGSGDGTVILWDAERFTVVRRFLGHTAPVTSLAFSHDGSRLYSASLDRTVKEWNTAPGPAALFDVMQAGPWSAPVAPDGQLFAATGSDTVTGFWRIDGTKHGEIPGLAGNAAAFSSDGRYCVIGNHSPHVVLWDMTAMREVRRYTAHTNSIYGVDISLRTGLIASGSTDRTVRVWSLHDTAEVRRFTFEKTAPRYVAFSPDGSLLAAGATDGTITVWETNGWTQRAVMRQDQSVANIVFSSDGKRLVSGSGSGTCYVWDMKRFVRNAALEGHTAHTVGVAVHPDGSRIATASYDQTVRIWDTTDGTCVLTLRGFPKELYTVSFVNKGTGILVTQTDGMVHVLSAER